MLVSLCKIICRYFNNWNIGVKENGTNGRCPYTAPCLGSTQDPWVFLGLRMALDSRVGTVVWDLLCLTPETFPLKPSGLPVSHYSFSLRAFKYIRKTDLQSDIHILVLNLRNLKITWYSIYWGVIESFPWSNKWLTCICSTNNNEVLPWVGFAGAKRRVVSQKWSLTSNRSRRTGAQHANRRSPSKIQSTLEGLSTWSQGSLQWWPNFILRSRYFQTEIWRRQGNGQVKERNWGRGDFLAKQGPRTLLRFVLSVGLMEGARV